MKATLILCAILSLSGCITREVKEDAKTTTTEKSVTKEDRTHVVDLVADVPGVGVVQIKGQLTETTFSETMTEGEANTARRLVESNPAVQQGMQMIVSAGTKAMSGDWLGAGKELLGYVLFTVLGGGVIRSANQRAKRAEQNEDEVYNDLKATKLKDTTNA